MPATETSSYHESALDLHRRCRVVDAHCDTISLVLDEGHAFAEGSLGGHIDVPRLKAAHMGIQVLACWNEPEHSGVVAFSRCMAKIGSFYQEQRKGGLRLVRDKADLDVPELGFILSLEDAAPCMGSTRHIDVLYAAGVRMIGLTWNGRNEIADGLAVGDRPGGLTDVGKTCVAHMQRIGIVVDLSHIAEVGFWDVVEESTKPLACSHSNAKSLHEHRRNLTDAQIKAIADSQGVIGVTYVPSFLAPDAPGIDDVIRHIEHIVEVGGIDTVGLGSDFDGIQATPVGLEDVSRMPALTARLLERGWKEEDLIKLLGGNWIRVFKANWVS